MTTRQLTAHYHRSQRQEPAPVLVLVGGDGQDARGAAPFMDPADRRRYTLQQGSSSWPLWVDATDLCCLRDLTMMMMMMMMMIYIKLQHSVNIVQDSVTIPLKWKP